MMEPLSAHRSSARAAIFPLMKMNLFSSFRKWAASLAAIGAFASCSAHAVPDFNEIGRQFSLVLQNAHFSHTPFSKELSRKFLESYLKQVDPARLYLTKKDVDLLQETYGDSFGDYLLAGETSALAQKLYAFYSEKALARIAAAEKTIAVWRKAEEAVASTTKELQKAKETKDAALEQKASAALAAAQSQLPSFQSDKTIPRSRRKVEWAADDSALDRVWADQLEEYMLSETLRRANVAKLAKEQGKADPLSRELMPAAKLEARYRRLKNVVQEADLENMVTTLLSSVAHVYDPHTDYMGAREEERFKEMMINALTGIGALLQAEDDGTTKINGIVKGGPTEKCGELQLGDKIIAVDHDNSGHFTDILYMGIDKVVDLIRGPEGVPVSLRVVPESNPAEVKIVTIVRQKVEMKDEFASAKIIDMRLPDKRNYRLGLLTLPSFYVDMDGNDVRCASDVKKLLRRMNEEKVEGLVIDLRNNGGGSLDEVRKMVGFFTGAGPVVQVRDFRGVVERLRVAGKAIFDGPMVVLCNKLSASASEIFAGAMADYGRAIIVGDTTTFGKGTVQVPRSIGDYLPYFTSRERAGMLKVTMQKFYRISGDSTQLKGVASDIVIPTASAGFEIGESVLDYAMPYDKISKAPQFVKSTAWTSLLPELKKRSDARVAADKDMQYMADDIRRFRKRTEENKVSLNRNVREKENAELMQRKKDIDAERKARYVELAKKDADTMTIYRLTLADTELPKLPLAGKEEDNSFMNMQEDPTEKLAESPEYPSHLDPELRECLHIVRDMIDLKK